MAPHYIQAEIDAPLVFRTTSREVMDETIRSGSLWLRSNRYYQRLEDSSRCDSGEGVNATQTFLLLRFITPDNVEINISGSGTIGQEIGPHYLACFHGAAISTKERAAFGGHTLGVRNFARLAAEVLYRASQQIPCSGYRYGPVSYRHMPLSVTHESHGAAFGISKNPPISLRSHDSDVLVKSPATANTAQDEWRIAVFTGGWISGDENKPLQINVSPSHFYPYT